MDPKSPPQSTEGPRSAGFLVWDLGDDRPARVGGGSSTASKWGYYPTRGHAEKWCRGEGPARRVQVREVFLKADQPSAPPPRDYVLASTAAGDWEALYVGGRLIQEHHTITPMDILRACRDRGAVGECFELVLPDDLMLKHGGRFPSSLWDLGEDWWKYKQASGPAAG